jgi:segregation and condensation protein A
MTTQANNPHNRTENYRVSQSAFHGPLDLLLFLVKKNEVDIREVSLAKLADEFFAYIQALQNVDIEWAGEFLVTAATLMEIKSRSLLPTKSKSDSGEHDDPRQDLVRQLLEYRKYKDAARVLEDTADRQLARVPRTAYEETDSQAGPTPVKPVELWDLVAAFGRLMRETQSLVATKIQVDDTPQHVYAEMVLARLADHDRLLFRDIFLPPYTKSRLIGFFLAILELIKGRQIILEQAEAFGEIWLSINPDRSNIENENPSTNENAPMETVAVQDVVNEEEEKEKPG